MSSKIATEVSGNIKEGDVIVLEASTEEQVKKSASSEGANNPFMPQRPGGRGGVPRR